MKCSVCGNENVNSEQGECLDCGFELIGWTGNGTLEEYERIMKETAESYRKEIREDISIGIIVYSYQRNSENKLEVKSENRIVLSEKLKSGVLGAIQWYGEKFARIDAGEEMVLKLFVQNGNKEEMKKEVRLKAPDWGAVFWKVGIREEEKLHFRFVLGAVGDDSKIVESDSISMVR